MDESENLEKERQQLCVDLMKNFGSKLMKFSIDYRSEFGIGILNIDLKEGSKTNMDELNIEYFRFKDIPKDLQSRLLESPDVKNTLYFSLNFLMKSYVIEKTWNNLPNVTPLTYESDLIKKFI